jgi:hypothetical protein
LTRDLGLVFITCGEVGQDGYFDFLGKRKTSINTDVVFNGAAIRRLPAGVDGPAAQTPLDEKKFIAWHLAGIHAIETVPMNLNNTGRMNHWWPVHFFRKKAP